MRLSDLDELELALLEFYKNVAQPDKSLEEALKCATEMGMFSYKRPVVYANPKTVSALKSLGVELGEGAGSGWLSL